MNIVRLLQRPRVQVGMAAAIYLGIALWLIWPVPLDMSTRFYGGTGDPMGALATLRELAEQLQPPFLPGKIHDFSAPDGLPVPWVRSLASLPGQLLLWSLAVVFGAVAAYDIFVLIGFAFSGTAAFLLARRITGSAPTGFVAGFALAFYPYAISKSSGHYEFAHSWVIVLAVWRMIELGERPTARNGVFAGLAVVFAMAWTPYFILLAGIAYLTLLAAALITAWREGSLRAQIRAQAPAAGLVLAYLVIFRLLAAATEAGQGLRANPREELITYSARLQEYILPDAGHELFGGWTRGYFASHMHGSNQTESLLYVGVVILLLALVAIAGALLGKLPRRQAQLTATFAGLAIVAALCSAPPDFTAFGHTFPMPSDLISSVTSTWRVYARLVVVVEVALVMLAAIGLAWILRGRPWPVITVLTALVVVAIWVDFSPRGQGYNPVGSVLPIYAKLKQQPEGIVVEYPLGLAATSDYDELLAQDQHGFPIFNGYEAGSERETEALSLADPSNPATAARLRALGVRYAVIRTVPDTKGLPKPAPGFKVIYSDSSGKLYRIEPGAKSRRAVLVTPTQNFSPVEVDNRGSFQWMDADTGEIELRGTCDPCEGIAKMTLEPFNGRAQTVTIEGATRPIRIRLTRLAEYEIPVRFNAAHTLKIKAEPGAQPVSSAIPGSIDSRSLALSVRRIRFVAASRAR